MPPRSTLIAVVDDDDSVRASISALFETRGWQCVNFERADALLLDPRLNSFNCLLLDVRMPGMNGLELFQNLVHRSQRQNSHLPAIVFLSAHGDIPMAVNVLKSGAVDFLEKPADPRTIIDAVGQALAIDHASRVRRGHYEKQVAAVRSLTPRELDILKEILAGYVGKQIAQRLAISVKTVETHRTHIYEKFNVHSSIELISQLRGFCHDFNNQAP